MTLPEAHKHSMKEVSFLYCSHNCLGLWNPFSLIIVRNNFHGTVSSLFKVIQTSVLSLQLCIWYQHKAFRMEWQHCARCCSPTFPIHVEVIPKMNHDEPQAVGAPFPKISWKSALPRKQSLWTLLPPRGSYQPQPGPPLHRHLTLPF